MRAQLHMDAEKGINDSSSVIAKVGWASEIGQDAPSDITEQNANGQDMQH